MALLTHPATNTTTYGHTEHPERIGAKEALKTARIARAVELLVQEPAPTVTTLADHLKVSRATVYRMLATPTFQALLRDALQGRLSMIAAKALDRIERTLQEGTPGLSFKAACWILERMDALHKLGGEANAKEWEQAKQRAHFDAMLDALRRRRRGEAQEGLAPRPEQPLDALAEAAAAVVGLDELAASELADAELLEPELRTNLI